MRPGIQSSATCGAIGVNIALLIDPVSNLRDKSHRLAIGQPKTSVRASASGANSIAGVVAETATPKSIYVKGR